jgi:hypothetical protein
MRGGCGGVAGPPFTIENGRTLTMQKTSTIWRLFFRGAALLAALITPALTFAQSCALCYSQAAGSGARLIQALRSGILILVFPPMLICIGLAIMAYRKRNQFDEE